MSTTHHGCAIDICKELQEAPMDECHKQQIEIRFHCLQGTLEESQQKVIGSYSKPQKALEQLARMVLVIRDYVFARKQARERGDPEEDTMESMVADVVQASLFTGGVSSAFTQPMMINTQLWGRENEIAILMQEISAEHADDVIDLWSIEDPDSSIVVPDTQVFWGLGKGVDLAKHTFLRSRSQGDLHVALDDVEGWKDAAKDQDLEKLNPAWPPPVVKWANQRQRHNTETRAWLDMRRD